MSSVSMVAVQRSEIQLGEPLPWALFDRDNCLMMRQGEVVYTDEELNVLMANHPLRKPGAVHTKAPPAAAKPVAAPAAAAAKKKDAPEEFNFSEMKLRVGDRLQLQPPSQVAQERFIVKLVGYLEGTSLLITPPAMGGQRLPLQEGENVVMRVFSGQNAFGFAATVTKIQKIPFEYLHLTFPNKIRGLMVRKAPRVKTRIVTTVTSVNKPATGALTGIISNISANGALLDSHSPLGQKGEVVKMAFPISVHGIEAFLNIDTTVRAIFQDEVRNGDAPPVIHHGVEFHNLQPNDSVILQSMIYHQMIENPQNLV